MNRNVSVVVVDKNARFSSGVTMMIDNTKNRLGTYSRDKIDAFKKKSLIMLERAYDVYVDFDIAVNDALDTFGGKLIDGYEDLEDKLKQIKPIISERESVSVYDKLQPMMTDEEFRKLGIDIDNENSVTELQEFKKELMMGNFPQAKENKGPVRRLIPRRDGRNRGVFNIWTSVLIGVLFLGMLAVLTFMYY